MITVKEFLELSVRKHMERLKMSTDQTKANEPTVGQPPASDLPETTVIVRQPDEFVALLGDVAAPPIHNFVGDAMQQWRMEALAKNGNHKTMDDAKDREIRLKYFYLHPVRINGLTAGEYVDSVRCVIFDANGDSYACVSEGIAQSLADIVRHIGMGPWTESPLIRIVTGRTRMGRNFYAIVPA